MSNRVPSGIHALSGTNDWHLCLAARTVAAGGVIAYPTEAVFGLGCLPMDGDAVHRILAIKRRRIDKGLILIAADDGQLDRYVVYPTRAVKAKVRRSWPGPVTWLLPARKSTPKWLRGRHHTLAVRVTAHPIAGAICRKVGALVSTSANPAGGLPAYDAARVRAYFADRVDYILNGKLGYDANPSTIRDALTDRVIRP